MEYGLIAYFFGLVIYPVFFFMYSNFDDVDRLLMGLWVIHYSKRILEVKFVHLHQDRKIGVGEGLGVVFYYSLWSFLVGYSNQNVEGEFKGMKIVFTILFLMALIGNGISHYMLRVLSLETMGKKRVFPNGFLFELVACPHYLCEVIQWWIYFLLCQNWATFAFAFVTTLILMQRSHARYVTYRAMENPSYPAHRRALFPMLF